MTVPLHPETVPGDPRAIRWVIPPSTLPVRGPVTLAPGEFGRMIRDGELEVVAEATCLLTVLPEGGRTWREAGAPVRSALVAALEDAAGWEAGGTSVIGPDAALAEAATHVIDGEVGDYVRSHGGQIDLVSAHDGCVEVKLTGACGHCPAASATLTHRVQTALRAAYPDLRELRAV